MLRSDTGEKPRVDPQDVRDLIGGIVFLALLGLGLYVNTVIN